MSNPIAASTILASRARRLGYATPWDIPEIAESVRVALADQERDEIRLARAAALPDESDAQAMERLAIEAEADRAAQAAEKAAREAAEEAARAAEAPAANPDAPADAA